MPESEESTRTNPAVDRMIDTAAPFAQPILRYLRDLVHSAAPDAVEEIKWSRPFFKINDTLVCQMAAFRHHVGFGFWSPQMTDLLRADGIEATEGAGSLGRISSIGDLPERTDLLRYIRAAAEEARAGGAASPAQRRPRASAKAPIAVPADFQQALDASVRARLTFEDFPPSCRREYLEWITTARRPETRVRRIQQAIESLEEGKRFHDKYR